MLSSIVIDADPSSSLRRALRIDLDDSSETLVSQDIYWVKDRDAYVFTPEYSGLMTVSMECTEMIKGSALDSIVRVYNNRGRTIAVNNDATSETRDAQVQFYVEADKNYYILAYGRRSVGSYQLLIDQPDQDSPVWEDHDFSNRIKTADTDSLDFIDDYESTVYGGIYPVRDQDIFKITIPYSGTYSIDMSTPDSILDSYLLLYNYRYRVVARNDDISYADTDSYIEFEAQEGDVFYIRADAWRGSIGTYELTVSCLEDYEPLVTDTDSDSDVDPLLLAGDISNSQQDTNTTETTGSSEGQTWLLAVAGTDYHGYANSLSGPAVDVEIVSTIATDQFGVDSDHSRIICGGDDLTYASFEAGVNWLAASASADDLVLIYYSGHGQYGSSYYLNDNEELLLPDNSIVSENTMAAWVSRINPAASKIVIIDSCYSGGFTSIAGALEKTAVISSSGHDQSAWDEVSSYYPSADITSGGIFSNWLRYGFAGYADTNNDGRVSFLEAFNYTDLNINLSTGTGWNNQDPQINTSIDLDQILARVTV